MSAVHRFDYILEQQAFAAVDSGKIPDSTSMAEFLAHPVHGALATCSQMRPSIDISVGEFQATFGTNMTGTKQKPSHNINVNSGSQMRPFVDVSVGGCQSVRRCVVTGCDVVTGLEIRFPGEL